MALMARARMAHTCLIVLVLGVWVQDSAAAQEPSARFIVSGTSTVRAWSCSAQGAVKVTASRSSGSGSAAGIRLVSATVAPTGGSDPVPGFPAGIQSVTVTVPVAAFECEEKEMTEHLRDTFKQASPKETSPAIVYQLETYTMVGAELAKTRGKLKIAGVAKPVAFEVRVAPSAEGLRAAGETSIDMTEFGMKPPSLWGDLLKVGKVVRVRFDALLRP